MFCVSCNSRCFTTCCLTSLRTPFFLYNTFIQIIYHITWFLLSRKVIRASFKSITASFRVLKYFSCTLVHSLSRMLHIYVSLSPAQVTEETHSKAWQSTSGCFEFQVKRVARMRDNPEQPLREINKTCGKCNCLLVVIKMFIEITNKCRIKHPKILSHMTKPVVGRSRPRLHSLDRPTQRPRIAPRHPLQPPSALPWNVRFPSLQM